MDEPSETAEPEKKPPSKPIKKADNGTVAARIEQVLRLRLNGCEFGEIRQYVAESGWGLQDRQIRTYIERADDLLVERRERSRKRLVARHVAQRQDLYRRCLAAADYRVALATLTDLAKLIDLYPDKNVKELFEMARDMSRRLDELTKREQARASSIPPPLTAATGSTDRGSAGSNV